MEHRQIHKIKHIKFVLNCEVKDKSKVAEFTKLFKFLVHIKTQVKVTKKYSAQKYCNVL